MSRLLLKRQSAVARAARTSPPPTPSSSLIIHPSALHRLTEAHSLLISLQTSITNTMASSSPVTPDTLVTIKVNLDGAPRRFKLPLRDVGINVLESKVRWNFRPLLLWNTPRHPSCFDKTHRSPRCSNHLNLTDNMLNSCDML